MRQVRGDSEVTIWGTGRPQFLRGRPRREPASCSPRLTCAYSALEAGDIPINGCGGDSTITGGPDHCRVVGFTGTLRYDASKPDGTPQKRKSRITALGWKPHPD